MLPVTLIVGVVPFAVSLGVLDTNRGKEGQIPEQ